MSRVFQTPTTYQQMLVRRSMNKTASTHCALEAPERPPDASEWLWGPTPPRKSPDRAVRRFLTCEQPRIMDGILNVARGPLKREVPTSRKKVFASSSRDGIRTVTVTVTGNGKTAESRQRSASYRPFKHGTRAPLTLCTHLCI